MFGYGRAVYEWAWECCQLAKQRQEKVRTGVIRGLCALPRGKVSNEQDHAAPRSTRWDRHMQEEASTWRHDATAKGYGDARAITSTFASMLLARYYG